MARTGLLSVPWHEPRQGARRRTLCLHQQPQFRRTAGAGGKDASGKPGNGGGGGGYRAAYGCAGVDWLNPWQRLQSAFSLLTIMAFALAAAPVSACSLIPDYKGPETNFELVQQADTIFIGTLVKSIGTDEFDRQILVKPTVLLKGQGLPKPVQINGYLSDRMIKDGDKQFHVRASNSELFDIWRPHPEVWIGGCSRQSFNQGMEVVLFFKRNGGKLEWFSPAFTRSSEDVSGPDALWVKAVKTYARIGRLPLEDQKSTLRSEMLDLRKDNFGDRDRTLLADDIERQLAGVGPISHVSVGSISPRETRWLQNIANETYHAQILPPEEVVVSRNDNPFWKFRWVVAAVLSIVVLVAVTALLRRRPRKNLDVLS
jgi:hypothetical protein